MNIIVLTTNNLSANKKRKMGSKKECETIKKINQNHQGKHLGNIQCIHSNEVMLIYLVKFETTCK